MRVALVLVLALAASCGRSPATPTPVEPPAAHPLDATSASVVATPPPVVHAATRAAIEAPHAGGIVALALTPDGKTAISCDELGGVRLWPALDGSREPLVVELPHPKQLAIAAAGDGYSVIVLDDVGGLIVSKLDRDGRTRAHVTLPAEPAYQDVAMTELGAIAWRADQTIELIGSDGAIKARLATEPGERLLDMAVSGPRALALVETIENGKATRRPRWVELGATKLAWGAWARANVPLGDQLALAPSGARYATLWHDDKTVLHAIVFESVTGSVIGDVVVGAAGDLGFVDNDHVAISTSGTVTWLTAKQNEKPSVTSQPVASPRPMPLLAFAGDRAISSTSGELVITSPAGAQYLGYAVESPTVAQVAADGQLLVGVGEAFVLLDRTLHVAANAKLGAAGLTIADARWLGGDDWLVVSSSSDGVTRLELADLAHGTRHDVRDKLSVVPVVMYEPSTHLVTLSLGDTPEVDRFDADKHALERVGALPKPKGFEQAELVPLAPALAGGDELVRVTVRDRPTIQWLRDPKALGKASASVTVDNASFAAADPAGHVFVWRNTPQNALELAIYAAGKPIGKLPNDGPVALWPDPKGGRVVEVGQRAVSMYTLDGKLVWAQELAGTSEALWLSDGAIAIVSATGIARLDAATGKVQAARCGWRFELGSKPHPVTPQIEPVCTQLVP